MDAMEQALKRVEARNVKRANKTGSQAIMMGTPDLLGAGMLIVDDLTELASDWYWEQDEAGAFTRVSGPVLEMLGIKVATFAGEGGAEDPTGWDEAERAALMAMIIARQPFLDFALVRCLPDGSIRRFRVSGEPMFNRSHGFIGYRGAGVEVTFRERSLRLKCPRRCGPPSLTERPPPGPTGSGGGLRSLATSRRSRSAKPRGAPRGCDPRFRWPGAGARRSRSCRSGARRRCRPSPP